MGRRTETLKASMKQTLPTRHLVGAVMVGIILIPISGTIWMSVTGSSAQAFWTMTAISAVIWVWSAKAIYKSSSKYFGPLASVDNANLVWQMQLGLAVCIVLGVVVLGYRP